MGLRIILGHEAGQPQYDESLAVLYCSTTDTTFGPVIREYEDMDAHEVAEAFLKWCREEMDIPDLRKRPNDANDLYTDFIGELAEDKEKWRPRW